MTTAFWHRYWLCLNVGWFVLFIVPEVYALCTNWRNTMSAWVWSFEKFQPGQPFTHWTALHFLFIAALLTVDVWLLGHFGFGWWR